MSSHKIIFLIPTLNEEEGIKWVLNQVFKIEKPFQVLLIDGGSTDNTVHIAKQYDIDIITQTKHGKGNALLEGFKCFKQNDAVIMIDGDGTYDPLDGLKINHNIRNGYLINGSRFKGQITKYSMTPKNFIGNRFFNLVFSLFNHTRITDILSGLKGFIINDLNELDLNSEDFGIEVEMMTKYFQKMHILEIPVNYYHRQGLSKSKLHPVRDGVLILKKMIQLKHNN
jgi:dolichol-phosphate hexosyltransferase